MQKVSLRMTLNIKLSLGLILKKLLSIMMQLLSQKNDCSMIRTF